MTRWKFWTTLLSSSLIGTWLLRSPAMMAISYQRVATKQSTPHVLSRVTALYGLKAIRKSRDVYQVSTHMEKIIGQLSDSYDVRNRDRTFPECSTAGQEVTLNVATTPTLQQSTFPWSPWIRWSWIYCKSPYIARWQPENVSGKFSIWLQVLFLYLVSAALPVFVQRYPLCFIQSFCIVILRPSHYSHQLRDQYEQWHSPSTYVCNAITRTDLCTLTLNSPTAINTGLRGCATPSLVSQWVEQNWSHFWN